MKELPILFSTSMVQAILDGHKTMTRRIVKTTHNGWDCQKMNFTQSRNIEKSEISEKYKGQASQIVGFHAFFTDKEHNGHQLGIKCHFGQPGDILWVRETYCHTNIEYENKQTKLPFCYKADVMSSELPYENMGKEQINWIWKPSIHMSKDAARIWLQVEEIKIERLQDITETDALAEGFPSYGEADWMRAKYGFEILWRDIYGEESWQSNPWVWVIKFKVLSTTGKPENIPC